MILPPATRYSKPPLGGISGDWRRRFLRFHVPVALASALVLVLFTTLPRFDASAYLPGDIFSGTFPRDYGEGGGPLDHSADQNGPMDGGEGQDPQQQGGGHQAPQQQGGDRPAGGHGGDEAEQVGGDS